MYDRFNHGNESGRAIQEFLRQLRGSDAGSNLRYLLLAGDADWSLDYVVNGATACPRIAGPGAR